MTFKVPAKTFLVGEYAVLEGESALVISHEPYFEFGPTGFSPHPESPAGRLKPHDSLKLLKHPLIGAGGFGASTAEFIAAWFNQNEKSLNQDWWRDCLKSYKDLHLPGNPSGADLTAQIIGGITKFSPKDQTGEKFDWPFPDLSFSIFKTGTKVQTHDHLLNLKDVNFSLLKVPLNKTLNGFSLKNQSEFIHGVKEYRNVLQTLNLEILSTTQILDQVLKNPQVLAAKGCGALGADSFIVFTNQKLNQDFGFQLIATEDSLSRGVQWS